MSRTPKLPIIGTDRPCSRRRLRAAAPPARLRGSAAAFFGSTCATRDGRASGPHSRSSNPFGATRNNASECVSQCCCVVDIVSGSPSSRTRSLRFVIQSVVAHGNVAVIVLGTDREVESFLEPRQRRLQQNHALSRSVISGPVCFTTSCFPSNEQRTPHTARGLVLDPKVKLISTSPSGSTTRSGRSRSSRGSCRADQSPHSFCRGPQTPSFHTA